MIVAAAQFTSESGSVDANARRMAAYVREAAGRGARVTGFAELALTGYELDGVRFALATCFDNHFPELAERAAAYPARAKDHGLYVALANHVGRAGPYDACGLSAVWGPDGTALAEAAPDGAGLALADVPTP